MDAPGRPCRDSRPGPCRGRRPVGVMLPPAFGYSVAAVSPPPKEYATRRNQAGLGADSNHDIVVDLGANPSPLPDGR